jgi:hypothetical protein
MAIKTRLTPEAIQSLQAEDETKALDGGAPMDITAAVRNGGFPIRLAKTQHLDKQRDSEKKKNAIRKSSARNDQIRGLFGSPP